MISGRRMQRLREQSRWRWLVMSDGPNRHERRKHQAADKEPLQFSWIGTRMMPDADEAIRLGVEPAMRNKLKAARKRDRLRRK